MMSRYRLGMAVFFLLLSFHAGAWRFAVTGDSRGSDHGVNRVVLVQLAKALSNASIQLVLFTGDLVDGSGDDETVTAQMRTWRNIFMEPLLDAGIRVYPVRGNHDLSDAAWDAVFSGAFALPGNGPACERNRTYTFAYENARFFALDCYAPPLSQYRVNVSWLARGLWRNDRPLVFAFGHIPAFPVLHPDSLALRFFAREAFWNVLGLAGGRYYFCGHDHFFDDSTAHDWFGHTLHQVVAGTAGAPEYTWDGHPISPRLTTLQHNETPGYVIVDVEDEDISYSFVPLDEGP